MVKESEMKLACAAAVVLAIICVTDGRAEQPGEAAEVIRDE